MDRISFVYRMLCSRQLIIISYFAIMIEVVCLLGIVKSKELVSKITVKFCGGVPTEAYREPGSWR